MAGFIKVAFLTITSVIGEVYKYDIESISRILVGSELTVYLITGSDVWEHHQAWVSQAHPESKTLHHPAFRTNLITASCSSRTPCI